MTSNAQSLEDPRPGHRVLLLTPTGDDASNATAVLGEAGVEALACPDIHSLCQVAGAEGAAVLVVAVEALDGGRHLPLVGLLAAQPAWSDLPVVIITSGGERAQTSLREYLGSGTSITFLERPFRAVTLTSVVTLGLRARQRQYELRDLLAQRELLLREAEAARARAEAQAGKMSGLAAAEAAARAEAERASHLKDEFLATLSHELRTPLNAILGWSQLLAREGGVRDEQDLAEGLRTIERNARAQTLIIEDLLDMSRIINGKVRLDVQRTDLVPVIEAAMETVRPAAEAKEIRVQRVLDPLAGPVSGDPNRLQQVFWNLLSNAIKFTPRAGRVQVLLERVNSHLEVSVIDTGEGIKPEFLPHVFDRFLQADRSTTRRHGGLGLGLSIVKQLVELHGGTIRAKSAGPGRGSTFIVALPLTVVHPEHEPEPQRRHPTASPALPQTGGGGEGVTLAGVKVLVVDDEPDARALVRRVLEDCRATVVTAGSAAEALELLRNDPPAVLVSDIGMPGEDGYALIHNVRALGRDQGGDTPAVALTAYARSEDRVSAVQHGFQMHVAKPVEPAELVMMVAALAGRTGPRQRPPAGGGPSRA